MSKQNPKAVVWASSWEYLRDSFYPTGEEPRIGGYPDARLDMEITTACGRLHRFEYVRDLPQQTLLCECGNPDCIVIAYGWENHDPWPVSAAAPLI